MNDLFSNLDPIESQIIQLTKELNYYNLQYHTYDKSLISDEEYDLSFRRLMALDLSNINGLLSGLWFRVQDSRS